LAQIANGSGSGYQHCQAKIEIRFLLSFLEGALNLNLGFSVRF
jgi:hypothetical protein